jgi:hypothetical protein
MVSIAPARQPQHRPGGDMPGRRCGLETAARNPHIFNMVAEPLNDEKFWRVVVSYENARGGDWYGPLETLADAEARLKREESWSRQFAWIEDANGTPRG